MNIYFIYSWVFKQFVLNFTFDDMKTRGWVSGLIHLGRPSLVDISRINGLDGIKIVEGYFCIGAMVTHSQASRSEILRREAPVLS